MYFSRKMIVFSSFLLLLFFLTFLFISLSNAEKIAVSKNEAFLEEIQIVSKNFYLAKEQKARQTLDEVSKNKKLLETRKQKSLRRQLNLLIKSGDISGGTIEEKNGALIKTIGNPGAIKKKIYLKKIEKTLTLEKISPVLFLAELRSLTGKEFSLWQDGQLLGSTLPGSPLPENKSSVTREGSKYQLGEVPIGDSILVIAVEDKGFTWDFPKTAIILLFLLTLAFFALQIIVRKNSKKQILLILESAKRMTKGDFKSNIPTTSSREINLLADEMGRMGKEISSLVESLKKAKNKLEETIKKSAKVFSLGPDEKESFRLLLDMAIQISEAKGGMIENYKRGGSYIHSLNKEEIATTEKILNSTPLGKSALEKKDHLYFLSLPILTFDKIIAAMVIVKESAFSDTDRESLQYLLSQAGVALENNELHARLKKEAATDDLTGLANRRTMRESLEKERERSIRFQRPFSLMLIDVDNFKSINDKYGHSEGDTILCSIAETIEKSMRHIDLVARWGGEEFLVLLPETDIEDAKGAAKRLGKVSRSSLPVTLSIGISTYPASSENIDDLILLADAAMYEAKESGKNCFRVSE
jgi:diguanylate cyclase (GGDEF)-like protein